MMREKLFLSTVFLILSLMSGLACVPLFGALIANQQLASQLGSAVIILLPVVSLSLLWQAKPASNYDLRRLSFLFWAIFIMLVGISNAILLKEQSNSNSTMLMLGFVCVAISFHARYKGNKQKAKQTSS